MSARDQWLAVALGCAIAMPAVAGVPARSTSGATLVVPEEHAALGRVYYVRYPSETGQITFTSDAAIEVIVGRSSRVVGYAVLEEQDGLPTGRIMAGGFRLPVRSLDSGIPLRDYHMQAPNFFDASRFPDITFGITGSRDVTRSRADKAATIYALTLLGDLTMRGVTHSMTVPARLTLMPASKMTRNAGPGDVMVLRCSYSVKRTEFGVGSDFVNPELVDEIGLEQRLVFTTTSFDDRFRGAEAPEKEMRLQHMVALIRDMRDLDAADEYGQRIMADYRDDAHALNALAWNVATTEGTDVRRLPWLAEAAERAAGLSGGEDADVLDTTARVHYERGDLAAAVRWQRQAVAHRGKSMSPDDIVRTLHEYETQAGVPLTEIVEEEAVDRPQGSAAIAPYAGTYRVETRGFDLTFVDRNGRLHLQPPGDQPPIALLYQGDHEFRMEGGAQIVFVVEGGPAVGLSFRQGRTEMKAVRVE